MKYFIVIVILSMISCSKQEQMGKDHLGNMRTCTEMSPDTMCTREITEADDYANECREHGKRVVQCGCHDYICFEKDE